jgi:hypothetical protein
MKGELTAVRSVSNSLVGNQGLSGFPSYQITKQETLLDIMNKETAKKQKLSFTPMIDPKVTTIINNDKGLYDPKTGTWTSSGNISDALNNLEDRQAYNQIINDALAGQGIKLSSREKMTLSIDKDGLITVSGITDQQKKARIEETLNNAMKGKITGLMMHIESVKAMNGRETPGALQKWMVYDFLKREAGQDLGELKLVDGKITGANEKLQEIIDGKRDFGENTEYAREVIANLKIILTIGQNKIPDLQESIDFQNGSLIDKDVENGFGPNQLTTWFQNFISGKSKWDINV